MSRFFDLSSQLLHPLQVVAKEDPFSWTKECEEVFQIVKEVLGDLPTMQAPIWDQIFYVNSLVGEDGIGAMLLKKGKISHYMRPVYCVSRVKTPMEMVYSKVELLLLAITFACQNFRHYFLPKPFF